MNLQFMVKRLIQIRLDTESFKKQEKTENAQFD